MNVNEIRKQINQDFLRNNRYKVTLVPPAALIAKYTNKEMDLINKNCASVNIPGSDMATFDYANKSAPIVLPYQRTYNPLVLTFYNDAAGVVRRFFENWFDIVWNPETYDMNYLSDYSVTFNIELLDTKNKPVLTFNINNAWPMKIDDIPVAFADGEIQKVTATLTYNIYKIHHNK